ncbi:MAG TPA: DUF296 domain-containing protein [Lentisphaeria bacterium]|nr:MAG: DNA-binding protein [Lentisphaerae bacterium GWF2_38_69]HBM17043.1 DUF296 domain-containing protein [Lentisphaeria bacterium]
MKYSEAKQGRVFILRLEDGDIVHETIERFAAEKNIKAASLICLGGADKGSVLITGPECSRSEKIETITNILDDAHEILGVGTIFPDENEHPHLHMHIACGRDRKVTAGCIRRGVKTWYVIEVVITELVDTTARRLLDPVIGFSLLQP